MKKFFIHSMGCKANQFEGSVIKENLEKNGMSEVKNIEDADIYILNSCTVTHKSDNEALYLLRNAKHKNSDVKTVITGCIAQIEKEKLLENDFIDFVVGNDEKLDLYKIIEKADGGQEDRRADCLQKKDTCIVGNIMQKNNFTKTVLEDMSKTRASLKIQDGCDNRCSYCIIPFARGKSRSADIDFVIEQINNFSKNGFKEVILTGIHIGQWGRDFGLKFIDLINAIEEKTTIERYSLGSLNPLEIDDELLDVLNKSAKFCPHFHLSLQSACNKTLKSMNRLYRVEDYLAQIEQINSMFDLPFLGSDIITGFAGETEEDFNTTLENLKKSGLTQIHTFPYSVREGTVGADMENQVPENIRQERAEIVKKLSAEKYNEFVEKNIGTVSEVLVQKIPDKKTGFLKGITRNYLTVLLDTKDKNLINTLQRVKLTKFDNNTIYGEREE
ncbi:tRNA (N(6)-L-threonylcarbamoyladenosine(37)-C(2))-methylthiotransferase MtaB [bacterium]|nr:tRNA (N(6)-L-threonylcarbamoyladenosine(37)-C(2))-methylthiotransferase MtaB [bacterium]